MDRELEDRVDALRQLAAAVASSFHLAIAAARDGEGELQTRVRLIEIANALMDVADPAA